MTKTVLDVGNCGPDHAAIQRMLSANFKVHLLQADNARDTMAILKSQAVHLVLVNRKLDEDYSDGVEIIKLIKSDPELHSVPVMLITNYEEHQQQAIALGAVRGFGKLSINSPETRQIVSDALEGA